ncbi:hypothetical protein P5673_013821 [Acropora cervicornis]|uniref:Uncharacterized protein n=1 Tax=Acropora cervicornis TaxID=6130 RepID=A0AAD9QKD1_ACRCE|nr:hypothetical protein P5673_013821 [Acropora cervicornis]
MLRAVRKTVMRCQTFETTYLTVINFIANHKKQQEKTKKKYHGTRLKPVQRVFLSICLPQHEINNLTYDPESRQLICPSSQDLSAFQPQ